MVEREGPLHGVRVVEVGSWVAGPHAATLYADFGAEVIKVELPGQGDPARTIGASHEGVGLWWLVLGRNKRSFTLDIRSERGRDLFLRLMAKSDMLVENLVPGKLAELGLSSEVLWEHNPGLIIIRVSGFGQTGPLRQRPGFDPVAQAFGGILAVTGEPDGPPVRVGMPILDYGAATYAALGGLIALHHRQAHQGRGQEVDMSLYEAALPAWAEFAVRHSLTGHVPQRAGNRHPDFTPAELFPTGDRKVVQVLAIGDRAFSALCSAMGRPELAEDVRFLTNEARSKHRDELVPEIAKWTTQVTADDVVERCNDAGVPASVVHDVADLMANEHARSRENFVELHHPTLGTYEVQGVLPHLSATPGRVARTAPDLGADNAYVLQDILGLTPDDVSSLQRDGVM